ncbi:DUF4112 domain-containing protein [Phaeobacter porticola]|uniref:DUF4112 domain-containing protein n=1 Tax=Phaeobacter porticola TaxID=1844006 RepID=A0A1L3I5R3_9RHOB|nr:DUF4112 domain-containing protein [Phaeobacter porticola]APG47381.1 Domain protein of unknown function [Phaeobacter porticola]
MPEGLTRHESRLQSLEQLAHGMDKAFRLPVLGTRVGWDSILGLVPGVGDALALAPAGYIILSGYRMGASAGTLARMVGNVGVDTLIGTVPLIGDLFDIGWKANVRNVAVLRRHLEKKAMAGEPLAKRLARRGFDHVKAPLPQTLRAADKVPHRLSARRRRPVRVGNSPHLQVQ